MTNTEIGEAINKRLKVIANQLSAAGKAEVATDDLVSALQDPWICIMYTPGGPWRKYNTVTNQWGEEC